jgi:S1-C subfamily serine protease
MTAFCERNLRPIFALLVLLTAGTVAWAVVSRERKGARRAERGAGAASPTRAVGQTPGAVDATSMATPNGGIKLIRRRWAPPQAPGLGASTGPARMRLAVANPRARHAFNTVSSLVLPSVVGIHAARSPFGGPLDTVPGSPAADGAYDNVGSGFIIDSRGYALTNHHVVSQAADVLVSVFGKLGRDLPASVVATDAVADLALIRIAGAPPLPEVRLGDSASVQAGDWVLAFGSPFGLEQTVTEGIISSRRKSLVVQGIPYGDMLQTDAPINRGSSGGPLVNMKAEVIGINTAVYGPTGAFSGTGFAIPVDRAKTFLARCSRIMNR